MRYVKALLIAILFFLALVFFFQNQSALSQQLELTLNLFFIPPMTSISLPFYFLVVAAFFVGVLLAICLLLWDRISISARLMKSRWRVSALEREVAKLQKKLESDAPAASLPAAASEAAPHASVQTGQNGNQKTDTAGDAAPEVSRS